MKSTQKQALYEAFTRQHYIAIAQAIKDNKQFGGHDEQSQAIVKALDAAFKNFATELATTFKQDNPAFDKGRFLSACGF